MVLLCVSCNYGCELTRVCFTIIISVICISMSICCHGINAIYYYEMSPQGATRLPYVWLLSDSCLWLHVTKSTYSERYLLHTVMYLYHLRTCMHLYLLHTLMYLYHLCTCMYLYLLYTLMYLYLLYTLMYLYLLCTLMYIFLLMSPMSSQSLSVDSLLVATGLASQPTWLMVVV